jgi:hypothetical protein
MPSLGLGSLCVEGGNILVRFLTTQTLRKSKAHDEPLTQARCSVAAISPTSTPSMSGQRCSGMNAAGPVSLPLACMGVVNNSAVTNPSVSRQHSFPSWNTALAIEAAKTAEMVEKLPAVCYPDPARSAPLPTGRASQKRRNQADKRLHKPPCLSWHRLAEDYSDRPTVHAITSDNRIRSTVCSATSVVQHFALARWT